MLRGSQEVNIISDASRGHSSSRSVKALLHSHKAEHDIWMKTHNNLLIQPQSPVHRSICTSATIPSSILCHSFLIEPCTDPRLDSLHPFPLSLTLIAFISLQIPPVHVFSGIYASWLLPVCCNSVSLPNQYSSNHLVCFGETLDLKRTHLIIGSVVTAHIKLENVQIRL